MFDVLVILLIIAIILCILAYMAYKTKKMSKFNSLSKKITFEYLLITIKEQLAKLDIDEDLEDFMIDDTEFMAAVEKRRSIVDSLKRCIEGRISDKIKVKSLINAIISDILVDNNMITDIYNFEEVHLLPPSVKFETILHFAKKEYGREALKKVIEKYSVAAPKKIIEGGTKFSYAFTIEELNIMYTDLLQNEVEITRTDKLEIISTMLYQQYKGFRCMDTIDEMDIDGWNIGTSGAVNLDFISDDTMTFHNSAWVQLSGKYIHFRFLEFKDMQEIANIVKLTLSYGSPGALTAKKGIMVHQMADMSRVAAVRPPVSDCWAVFVRKFSHSLVDIRTICMNPKYKNAEIPYNWFKFFVKGQQILAITGRQSSGKTTVMKATMEFIDAMLNIRTIEMSFELNTRQHFPERNALGMKETQFVSATQIQDFCKKTDSAVTLLGEIATNEVAANAMQGAKVASLFMMFTHHAITMVDLIIALRDSLVNGNGFEQRAAEKLVIETVDVNIHADFNTAGDRFFERGTERIILDEVSDYPNLSKIEYNPNQISNEFMNYLMLNDNKKMNEITREYYRRVTDRRQFVTSDLFIFDKESMTYKPKNYPSASLIEKISKNLSKQEKKEFYEFILKYYAKIA